MSQSNTATPSVTAAEKTCWWLKGALEVLEQVQDIDGRGIFVPNKVLKRLHSLVNSAITDTYVVSFGAGNPGGDVARNLAGSFKNGNWSVFPWGG